MPSIVAYVVFNEGWGQYETERVSRLAQSLDGSRLFDPASGWVDAPVRFVTHPHATLLSSSICMQAPRACQQHA